MGLWLGQCLHFSSGSRQNTFLYQRSQNVRLKILCRYQHNFSMFSEIWRCFLQQQRLVLSLWRATYSHDNSLCCLGVPQGHLWSTTQLNVTYSQYCRFQLVIRDVQLLLCLPPIIWWFHLDGLHIFQEVSPLIDFDPSPQMALNFSSIFLYSLICPPHL